MKTKINAMSIYMSGDDILKTLSSSDEDDDFEKRKILEKIQFLKEVQGSEVYCRSYDDSYVKIGKYENSKAFSFPISIIDTDTEEEVEEEEEEKKVKVRNFDKIKNISIIILFILFLITSFFLNAEKKEAEAQAHASEILLKKEQVNKLNIKIAHEYELQKTAREEVISSIERVKSMDQEKNIIERELLVIINPK